MKKVLKEQEQTPIQKAIDSGCFVGGNHIKTARSANHPEGAYVVKTTKKYNNEGKLDDNGEIKNVYYYNDNQIAIEVTPGKLKLVTYSNGQPKLWNCKIETTDIYNELFRNFNILEKRDEKLVAFITDVLQRQFVDKGNVSDSFTEWNEMLKKQYPNVKQLVPKEGNLLAPPFNQTRLQTQFERNNEVGQYGWTNVVIYKPKAADQNLFTYEISKDEQKCIRTLGRYLKAAFDQSAGIILEPIPQLLEFQREIKQCDAMGKYDNFKGFDQDYTDSESKKTGKFLQLKNDLQPYGIVDKTLTMKDIKKLLRGETVHGVSITGKSKKGKGFDHPSVYILNLESKQVGLKKMIKENLLEVSKSKKEKQIVENRIIKTRFSIISEDVNFKSNRKRNNFFRNLVSEMNYLNSQGFDGKLIKESFWDVITGLLGDDKEMVASNFKKSYAEWLLKQLTGDERANMISSKLEQVINDISTSDIHKITDCNYITKKLTDAIVEESINEVIDEPTPNSPIHKVIKDVKVEKMSDDDYYNSVENEVMSIICPKLGDIKTKMGDKADEMKYKALFT